jgi:hypothetical protein
VLYGSEPPFAEPLSGECAELGERALRDRLEFAGLGG